MVESQFRSGKCSSKAWLKARRVLRLPLPVGWTVAAVAAAVVMQIATPLLAAVPQQVAQSQAVVEEEVHVQMMESADGKAYVIVMLRAPRAAAGTEARRVAVRSVQDRVLANRCRRRPARAPRQTARVSWHWRPVLPDAPGRAPAHIHRAPVGSACPDADAANGRLG